MSTRFLIPIRKGHCLSTPSMMPQGLSPYCHPDDFMASMARIEAANTSPALVRLLYVGGWMGYVLGLVYMLNTPYYMQNQFWTSFSVLFGSLFVRPFARPLYAHPQGGEGRQRSGR